MQRQTTILVIDDEEGVRDSCRQTLSKDGYRVETAGDGDSGLQKVEDTKPDLVLVDLVMPGIGGMELLQEVRDIDPDIACVVITGCATVELAVEAMKRNACDLICKPFTPDYLRLVVKRGLERRVAIEQVQLKQEEASGRKEAHA